MFRTRRRLAMGLVLALGLCGVRRAAADESARAPDDWEQASRLHQDAERALKAGDWSAACRLYEKSQALDASATTGARIAQCLEHDGHVAGAVRAYEAALGLVSRLDPARRTRARDLFAREIARLEPRAPKVRFAEVPAVDGRVVEIDGKALDESELGAKTLVDSGSHTIEVRASGFEPHRCELQAAEGKETVVEVVFGGEHESCGSAEGRSLVITLRKAPADRAPNHPRPKTAGGAGKGPKATPADAGPGSTGARPAPRVFGWGLGGAGLVALGAAGYFGIRTLTLVGDADCDEQYVCSQGGMDTIDQAAESQTAGFVALGVGAVLVGGGIALLLTSTADTERSGSRKTFVLSASTRGASLAATW